MLVHSEAQTLGRLDSEVRTLGCSDAHTLGCLYIPRLGCSNTRTLMLRLMLRLGSSEARKLRH
jgi:hypothetical protein